MANAKEHKRFCDRDGWELYKVTDHYYYQKRLSNGELLLTKVSFGTGEYSPSMWRMILKKQLQVSQEYFNSVI